jgi:hypothetical protein
MGTKAKIIECVVELSAISGLDGLFPVYGAIKEVIPIGHKRRIRVTVEVIPDPPGPLDIYGIWHQDGTWFTPKFFEHETDAKAFVGQYVSETDTVRIIKLSATPKGTP